MTLGRRAYLVGGAALFVASSIPSLQAVSLKQKTSFLSSVPDDDSDDVEPDAAGAEATSRPVHYMVIEKNRHKNGDPNWDYKTVQSDDIYSWDFPRDNQHMKTEEAVKSQSDGPKASDEEAEDSSKEAAAEKSEEKSDEDSESDMEKDSSEGAEEESAENVSEEAAEEKSEEKPAEKPEEKSDEDRVNDMEKEVDEAAAKEQEETTEKTEEKPEESPESGSDEDKVADMEKEVEQEGEEAPPEEAPAYEMPEKQLPAVEPPEAPDTPKAGVKVPAADNADNFP